MPNSEATSATSCLYLANSVSIAITVSNIKSFTATLHIGFWIDERFESRPNTASLIKGYKNSRGSILAHNRRIPLP